MSAFELVRALVLAAGVLFFVAGTLGLLRFPDVYTRIHALTKADNLGLGLVVLAIALGAPSMLVAVKLIVIWLLVLVASSIAGHLVANAAHRNGTAAWRREPRQ